MGVMSVNDEANKKNKKKLCYKLILFATQFVCALLFVTIEIDKWWRMTKYIKPSIHNIGYETNMQYINRVKK